MAFLEVKNVSIKGFSACVPKGVILNSEYYEKQWGGYDNFLGATGIAKHRIAAPEVCASDLCYSAAEKLLVELGWDRESIDALVFVSQTPDFYNIPFTSSLLQKRLSLSESCLTFDISLGCSGWVYSLSVLSSLMQSGSIKRSLLLVGDTLSKICSDKDKSTYPLFGDAGTVTALEYSEGLLPLKFVLYTDGAGYRSIIINEGGYRNPVKLSSFKKEIIDEGIERCALNLEMDGMSVFSFGISKAPKAVKALIENYSINIGDVDLFTFHQANLFMNENIRKKLKIDENKVTYSLHEFGNTSGASIPLTLVTQRAEILKTKRLNHIACGFGVGLSWGAVFFETNSIVVPGIIEL